MAIKLPSWLPYDKFKHLVAGIMIFSVMSVFVNLNVGIISVIAAAIAKETIDVFYTIPPATIYKPWTYIKKLNPEWDKFSISDIIWTVALPTVIFSFIQIFS